jgi:hypothetical protein
MQATVTVNGQEFTFKDEDVVNPGEYAPAGAYNPYNIRPFLIVGTFGVIAVAFATCEQDALDVAVDAGKLEAYKVAPEDEDEDTTYLGNAGEAFDISELHLIDFPTPAFSFAALVTAATIVPA